MSSRLKPVPTVPDAVGYAPAPRTLSKRQRAIWRSIAASKPSSWWDGGSVPLLAALVAHLETLEQLQAEFARLGDLASPAALARLEQLSRLRDRESKAASSLATKMRLTQQSKYETRAAARRAALHPVAPGNPFDTFKTRRSA